LVNAVGKAPRGLLMKEKEGSADPVQELVPKLISSEF
jgi:hypothetical protein